MVVVTAWPNGRGERHGRFSVFSERLLLKGSDNGLDCRVLALVLGTDWSGTGWDAMGRSGAVLKSKTPSRDRSFLPGRQGVGGSNPPCSTRILNSKRAGCRTCGQPVLM